MLVDELRLGNWAKFSEKWYSEFEPKNVVRSPFTVRSISYDCIAIDYYMINNHGVEYIEPLPLTEGWLLKFGFKKIKNDFYKKGIFIHKRKRGFVINKKVPLMEYVHQLQNYYFANKGEEL